MASERKRRGWRRFFQIRLRSLFLLTLVACLWAPAVPQVWQWVNPNPPQQTLPSPYFLEDDVQYFSPIPNSKLHREATKMRQFRQDQELIDSGC